MISRISGTVEEVVENALTVTATSGLSYEVHIPTAVMRSLAPRLERGTAVSLVTYHYYQTDPSKSIPILIGFQSRLEKEFFERFITVSGVGPKAAVKALSQPIADIASAIDSGDVPFLKSLPGIGEQRAREIVAKLQGKMAKFGLIQGVPMPKGKGARTAEPAGSVRDEALEVLIQLQYKREEAQGMLEKAYQRKRELSTVEEVLNEVYRQKRDD